MFIVYNTTLINPEDPILLVENEAFKYGNTVFQSVHIVKNKWLFWEEAYFNLMAHMRKMRMQIPLNFTSDYFKEIALPYIDSYKNYRIHFQVFPDKGTISVITKIQSTTPFIESLNSLSIDVFKDVKILPTILSSVLNPKTENIVAQQFAKDNDLDDVILLTGNLQVARSIRGNIYYLKDGNLYSNSIEFGAYKQAIDTVFQKKNKVLLEAYSAFELQKAEEVFILSDYFGVLPVLQFRKKFFAIEKSIEYLNQLIE